MWSVRWCHIVCNPGTDCIERSPLWNCSSFHNSSMRISISHDSGVSWLNVCFMSPNSARRVSSEGSWNEVLYEVSYVFGRGGVMVSPGKSIYFWSPRNIMGSPYIPRYLNTGILPDTVAIYHDTPWHISPSLEAYVHASLPRPTSPWQVVSDCWLSCHATISVEEDHDWSFYCGSLLTNRLTQSANFKYCSMVFLDVCGRPVVVGILTVCFWTPGPVIHIILGTEVDVSSG